MNKTRTILYYFDHLQYLLIKYASKASVSNCQSWSKAAELSSMEYLASEKALSIIPPALMRLSRARALISIVYLK